MSLSSLVVRIGADVSGLDRGLVTAERNVDQFGKKIQPLGRSLTRIGNSASTAAGSLSRLGGVMPGVLGNTGALVRSLGTAGVVLGETTVLAVGLSKGMRLLQAASLAVAASSAPAWLAALASPAGIAIAAIAALSLTVWGLKKAWDALGTSDVDKRLMSLGAGPHNREALRLASMGAGPHATNPLGENQTAWMSVLAKQVQLIDAAWRQMQDGMKPIVGFSEAWSGALESVQSQLRIVGNSLSADAVQLRGMLQTLREIASVSGLLSSSAAVGMIRTDLLAIPKRLQSLDPRRFLGDQMDFRPTPVGSKSGGGLWGKLSGWLNNTGNTDSTGTKVGQVIQAGGGGGQMAQLVQAFASFGPMAAVLPVINGALEMMGPAIEKLLEPLVHLGRVAGEILAPILEMLAPVVQLVADLLLRQLAPVLKGITYAISFVMEAFGWLVRGIGRLIDKLPGISAKGVINAGQAMIDAAEAARRNANAADGATDELNKFASALSNIPRVLNVNALRHLVTGAPGSPPGGSPPPTSQRPPVFSVLNGGVHITITGATDPERTADAVARAVEGTRLRGGMSRLRLAVT